jgi:proteasome lid subunit RPN8/RPN11
MNATLNKPPLAAQSLPISLRSERPSPRPRRREWGPQRLVFSPLAWLKLQFFCHAGDTEVGGFGISSDSDPLYLQDFVTVVQKTTEVTVELDDTAVADHFDLMNDQGIGPGRCGRIWIHTHPGSSPAPSRVDEETFERVFGSCDWALMFIVARSGQNYARLRFNAGPGGTVLLPTEVDWSAWPAAISGQLLGLDQSQQPIANDLSELTEAWMDEYGLNVWPELFAPLSRSDEMSLDMAHTRRESALDQDQQGWEWDPELSALAQLEAEMGFAAQYDRYPDYPRSFLA